MAQASLVSGFLPSPPPQTELVEFQGIMNGYKMGLLKLKTEKGSLFLPVVQVCLSIGII